MKSVEVISLLSRVIFGKRRTSKIPLTKKFIFCRKMLWSAVLLTEPSVPLELLGKSFIFVT